MRNFIKLEVSNQCVTKSQISVIGILIILSNMKLKISFNMRRAKIKYFINYNTKRVSTNYILINTSTKNTLDRELNLGICPCQTPKLDDHSYLWLLFYFQLIFETQYHVLKPTCFLVSEVVSLTSNPKWSI